jgi:hypothetical protein
MQKCRESGDGTISTGDDPLKVRSGFCGGSGEVGGFRGPTGAGSAVWIPLIG